MVSKKILCFGDSNTWGYIPDKVDVDNRYDENTRWTALLQKDLGKDFQVIEEGLNGRTTNLDYKDRTGKNGLVALKEILENSKDLNFVILMLGTNDLKIEFNQSPPQIVINLKKIIELIKAKTSAQLILVSPPIPKYIYIYQEFKYKDLEGKALELTQLTRQLAHTENVSYISLVDIIQSSNIDGAHLEPEEHKKISTLFAKKIKELLH